MSRPLSRETFSRTKRAYSIALCAAVALPIAPFVAQPIHSAHAAETSITKDQATITVQSDGTHNGPGTETFLNSNNGYAPGDNTTDDGVVASGDVVTYQVSLDVVAGPARTLRLEFTNEAQWLELTDFSGLTLGNSIISSRWNDGGLDITVPRGATGKLTGTVTVRAKDTHGEVKNGNVITATIKNEGKTVFTSKSKEITVISAPLADLTVDTIDWANRSYTQDSSGGEFRIDPVGLKIEGYASYGLISSTKWTTDIDVSDFPTGTMWKFDGQTVTPNNGVLKDLSGEGTKLLTYVLPQADIPTQKGGPKKYEIHLNVHADSFKVGDTENIPDPGNDQPGSYATSTYQWKGKNVGALDGRIMPNNNYSSATWLYYDPLPGEIWRYDVAAPTSQGATYFEDPSLYWNPASPYYNQGVDYPQRGVATNNNDLYNKVTIQAQNLDSLTNSDDLTVGDTLDNRSGDIFKPHDYDLSRKVVVTVGGTILDPSKFKAEFFVDGSWVESDSPLEGSKTSRVTFSKDAFPTGKGASAVKVYFPVKARNDYDPNTDSGEVLQSQGTFTIDTTDTPGVSYTGTDKLEQSVPLAFMQAPTIATRISPIGAPTLLPGSSYLTQWSIDDMVAKPPVSKGYSATRTITLDPIYNAQTFKLSQSSGWVVDRIEGQNVYLTRSNISLQGDESKWSIGKLTFSVESVVNPASDTGTSIAGNVAENITFSWGNIAGVGAGSSSDESKATQNIDSLYLLTQHLKALDTKKEVEEQLSWEAQVNLGRLTQAGASWSQDIVLPYNGDIEKINQVNQYNQSSISIDPDTGLDTTGFFDGVGRSKFNGSYDVTGITVNDAPANTEVWLMKRDGTIISKLPVGIGGKVDLTGVDMSGVEVVSVHGVDNTSDIQAAGMRVKIDVLPHDNQENDQYVMWVDPVTSPNNPAKTVMAWPEAITVVMSEVEGTLWQDSNRNAILDGTETSRFTGVTVSLQQKDASGNWVTVPDRAGNSYTTTTDDKGHYRFEGLHSGEYRVKLNNVEKDRIDTLDLDTVSGNTGTEAKDGNLPQAVRNRFDKLTATEMTRSYRQIFNTTNDTVPVVIPKDTTIKNVDYGFVTMNADMSLDKSPATVVGGADQTQVSWDVEVKNTGDTVISGATLNDRTSSEVLGLQASVGYMSQYTNKITGTVISDSTADLPAFIHDEEYTGTYGIATTDGIWIITRKWEPKGEPSPLRVIDFNEYVGGALGSPLGVSDFSTMGADAIITGTGGAWIFKEDYDTDVNNPYRAIEITGYDGQVISGNKLYQNYGESFPVSYILRTTTGIWSVDSDTGEATKVETISGDIISTYSSLGMYIVRTTDGVWYGRSPEVLERITDFTGEVQDIVVDTERAEQLNWPSFAIVTNTGIWGYTSAYNGWIEPITKIDNSQIPQGFDPYVRLNNNGGIILFDHKENPTQAVTVTDMDGTFDHWDMEWISGNILQVVEYSGGYLRIIATDQGIWLWNKSDDKFNKLSIPGNIRKISTFLSGFNGWEYQVLTDSGVWTGRINDDTGYNNYIEMTPPTQVPGLSPSNVVSLLSSYFMSDSKGIAITTDGLVVQVGDNLVPIQSEEMRFMQDQNLAESRESFVETNSQNRDFINRGYVLPDILPGQSVIVKFTGSVRNQTDDLVVGNQAWVTSTSTPREGIETFTNGEVQVNGSDMPIGTPDLPVLPDPSNVDKAGIHGTNTVHLNSDISTDSSGVDDLADQTPALIPGKWNAPPLDASISGVAWYDTEKNNVREPGEELSAGIKVIARDSKGNVVGTAVTDANGAWTISHLRDGEKVDIYYDVTNIQHNGKVWSPISATSSDSPTDSDIDSSGFVVRGDSVVARVGGNSGMADAGFQVVDAGINVIKAIKQGDEKAVVRGEVPLSDTTTPLRGTLVQPGNASIDTTTGSFDDRDNDPRTNAYIYTVSNNGNENLTNIALEDRTVDGNPAVLSSKLVYSGNPTGIYELRDVAGRKVVFDSVENVPVVIKPGEKLTANYHVGFTQGKQHHEDVITAYADAVSSEGVKLTTVTGNDVFSSTYEQVNPLPLVLRKVDDDGRNTSSEKVLGGAGFKIEKTNYPDLKNVKNDDSAITGEVGVFQTDKKTGEFTIDLPSGVYRIREVNAPKGYELPQSSEVTHFVQVSYDSQGSPVIQAVTINTAAAGTNSAKVDAQVETASSTNNWGKVEIDNASGKQIGINFHLPETGQAQLAMYGLLALGVLGAFLAWTRIGRKERGDDLDV